MALETFTLEHIPSSYSIHVALFRDVKNASFLHQQLLARNPGYEYAFINASVVISRIQVLAALFVAINHADQQALKTPNVHSEIVVSLSPSSNIADAYRRFGISPSTTDLIVVKVTDKNSGHNPLAADDIWKHLQANVEGTVVAFTDENLAQATSLQAVRKNYKLNGLGWLEAIKDEPAQKDEMEKLVVSAMALRGV